MSGIAGIYLIHDGGELVEMTEARYDSELLLQSLIERYPSLLAGDQVDPGSPRRWLLVSREVALPTDAEGTERWSLDHLFLDQDAIPTLVEVKRSQDTRLRREVVGQMLDYAANAVAYWPMEALRAQFEAGCATRGASAEEVLGDFLQPRQAPAEFWDRVKTNLQAGRIRLVFVADEVPTELRRIVEFLNQQMDPAEVLALEIRQYSGSGLKTLVPRVIGLPAEAQQKRPASSRDRRPWDEASFFEDLKRRCSPAEFDAARQLLAWAQEHATRVTWGRGNAYGSFKPVLQARGRDHPLFAVWTSGAIEICFHWYSQKPPFDKPERRLELLNRLNAIPGISLPADVISGLPTIPLETLRRESALRQFLATFAWVADEIMACV